MIGYVLAFFTAFLSSLRGVFSKESLHYLDEYVVSWSSRLFALPFLLIPLFFIDFPTFNGMFWLALFCGGFLNTLATIYFFKSMKEGELSLVIPMVAFTPLFLLFLSPLILGEFPNFWGLLGVKFIVIGSYMLNATKHKKGILEPIKSLFRNKASRTMLLVSFLWAFTTIFDKVGIENSSPLFWAFAINAYIVIIMIPLIFLRKHEHVEMFRHELRHLLPLGVIGAAMWISYMFALHFTLAIYVSAIKRVSIILAVLWGHFLFKEVDWKKRLLGASIMLIGVLLITLL